MSDTPPAFDVFLSHNHAGQPAVADLARRLAETGLHPWFAATHLIPGEPWQEAMEVALARSETVAVFVGPQGMGPWHNEEMRVAIEDAVQKGKRVIPVLLPGADPERISPFLKRRTWVDFRADLGAAAAFQLLLAGVRGETPFEAAGIFGVTWRKRHDLYYHIPLPPNYIPRPELLAEVRERLLAGTGSLALTSAIQIRQADVLHGMGGIGKSVLARALCEDPDVQAAFPDGILWATLGQTPDLTKHLREWIEALDEIVSQTAPTLDQLRNTLAEALQDKACLLIVDDAWRKAHLEPFRTGGPHCRLLITTRDAALTENLGARVYDVPNMRPQTAVKLLEEWAGANLKDANPVLTTEIVARLGFHPLAIALAGAQLSDRNKNPVSWLKNLDLTQLRASRVESRHDSLEVTFALSLNDLEPTYRRLYRALAIFREDELIPESAVAQLWHSLSGLNPNRTLELLDDLAARALLQIDRSWDRDSLKTRIVLHDLLREFLQAEMDSREQESRHLQLVISYCFPGYYDPPESPTWLSADSCDREPADRFDLIPHTFDWPHKFRDLQWDTIPDDGYLRDHLAYHLHHAAHEYPCAAEALFGLFDNTSWLRARVPRPEHYPDYLSDLDLAWRRASDAFCDPSYLPYHLRFALIWARIKSAGLESLFAGFGSELVAYAMILGLWPPGRALDAASAIADPSGRVSAYAAVLKTHLLDEEDRARAQREGIAAVLHFGAERIDFKAVVDLFRELDARWQAICLESILADMDEQRKVETLEAIFPYIYEETLHDLSGRAWSEIQYRWDRVQVASWREQILGLKTRVRSTLYAALAIQDEEAQVTALADLLSQGPLHGRLVEEVAVAVLGSQHTEFGPQASQATLGIELMALIARLNAAVGSQTLEILSEIIGAVQSIAQKQYMIHALHVLAPHIDSGGGFRVEPLSEKPPMMPRYHPGGILARISANRDVFWECVLICAIAHTIRMHGISDGLLELLRREVYRSVTRILFSSQDSLIGLVGVLSFCADEEIFAPPVFDTNTLAAFARHIIEICQEWEWL